MVSSSRRRTARRLSACARDPARRRPSPPGFPRRSGLRARARRRAPRRGADYVAFQRLSRRRVRARGRGRASSVRSLRGEALSGFDDPAPSGALEGLLRVSRRSDSSLLRRVAAVAPPLGRALATRASPSIARFPRRRCWHDLADDVLEETFLRPRWPSMPASTAPSSSGSSPARAATSRADPGARRARPPRRRRRPSARAAGAPVRRIWVSPSSSVTRLREFGYKVAPAIVATSRYAWTTWVRARDAPTGADRRDPRVEGAVGAEEGRRGAVAAPQVPGLGDTARHENARRSRIRPRQAARRRGGGPRRAARRRSPGRDPRHGHLPHRRVHALGADPEGLFSGSSSGTKGRASSSRSARA